MVAACIALKSFHVPFHFLGELVGSYFSEITLPALSHLGA